jgi:NAD-dependent deacetylase
MKKVLVFTGAGVSAESGISTFRDNGGMWDNYNIKEVATPLGWKLNRQKVLDFYNHRRRELHNVKPNLAHELIAKLEKYFDVIVVTQNVDDLHERAGSTNVVHLHGELLKARSSNNKYLIYDWSGDINIGDKCTEGSQLRPHIVWFGEMLDHYDIELANQAASECDICIIIGTSMKVSPANEIPFLTGEDVPVYYVDPGMLNFYVPEFIRHLFQHIQEPATIGMNSVFNTLLAM